MAQVEKDGRCSRGLQFPKVFLNNVAVLYYCITHESSYCNELRHVKGFSAIAFLIYIFNIAPVLYLKIRSSPEKIDKSILDWK